jgi:RNA polymerase sigma factor (sigma-70 family)
MPELSDQELLVEFTRNNSEEAFAALVSRYLNLVYSAARRYTGNDHHAEEITQAVFIILSKKAESLGSKKVLSGWLYQTARMTAANFIKSEVRRQKREQEAYMQSTMTDIDSVSWKDVAPLLDEAMGSLNDTDRDAIVLRFFERKTAGEFAEMLKMNQDAAQKRVSRALEKLRSYFAKRGVVLTAAAIAGAVSANSVQAAPVTLAAKVSAVAFSGAATTGTVGSMVEGVLRAMAWAKAKLIIGFALGLMVATVATPSAVHFEKAHVGADSWRVRFEDAYALKPGEVLKLVPEPFIAEREQYFAHDVIPRLDRANYHRIPNCLVMGQDAGGLHWKRFSECGEHARLSDAVQRVFGIGKQTIEGNGNLLYMAIDGDWVYRQGASQEEIIKSFKEIVYQKTGIRLGVEKNKMERDVFVVSGTAGRNTNSALNSLDVVISGNTNRQSFGATDFPDFLKWVGSSLRTHLISEITGSEPAVKVGWSIQGDVDDIAPASQRGNVTEQIIGDLSSRTGLNFAKEHRAVEVWSISDKTH